MSRPEALSAKTRSKTCPSSWRFSFWSNLLTRTYPIRCPLSGCSPRGEPLQDSVLVVNVGYLLLEVEFRAIILGLYRNLVRSDFGGEIIYFCPYLLWNVLAKR